MAYLNKVYRSTQDGSFVTRKFSNEREFQANWVHELRREYSLTQKALAERVRVCVNTVQNWENPLGNKGISSHNQNELQVIERDLYLSKNVRLANPHDAYVNAIYELLKSLKDEAAQQLGESLLSVIERPVAQRIRLHHATGIAYIVSDPNSQKALYHQSKALEGIATLDINDPLRGHVENDVLYHSLLSMEKLPAGKNRVEHGARLVDTLNRLYQNFPENEYLFNALEVAGKAPLPFELVNQIYVQLCDRLGEREVRGEIATNDDYESVRYLFFGSNS